MLQPGHNSVATGHALRLLHQRLTRLNSTSRLSATLTVPKFIAKTHELEKEGLPLLNVTQPRRVLQFATLLWALRLKHTAVGTKSTIASIPTKSGTMLLLPTVNTEPSSRLDSAF